PHAHADLGKDLVVELRRRHQPARRLHEPPPREARRRGRQDALQDGSRRRLPATVKSIGARLTAWYAFTATATLLLLFVAGYFALEHNLVHGLDLLNAAEFEQIRSRLGPDPKNLGSVDIDERIRETTEYAKVLFFIDVHSKETGTVFRSTNLAG